MDKGAWWATVHRAAKESDTTEHLSMHAHMGHTWVSDTTVSWAQTFYIWNSIPKEINQNKENPRAQRQHYIVITAKRKKKKIWMQTEEPIEEIQNMFKIIFFNMECLFDGIAWNVFKIWSLQRQGSNRTECPWTKEQEDGRTQNATLALVLSRRCAFGKKQKIHK